MSTRLTSRNGVMALTLVIAAVCGLALLSTLATQGFSERTLAANLLAMSFVVFTVGGALYAGRAFLNWQIDEASPHILWERGLIIAAVVAAVLGLALLEDLLRAAGEPIWSRVGMVAYLLGAVVVVTAETAYLGKRDWVYPQIVLYVVLGFLAQAAFGVSLLQTGLVASWAGWATILWNLGWLSVMLIIRPRDIYFPVLHHVAPLLIGIALLAGG
jgi:hypothetical protein